MGKNTPLARNLARHYERMTGKEFPGGVGNACIVRTYAGFWQKRAGYASWNLGLIRTDDSEGHRYPAIACFGSEAAATVAVTDPDNLIFVSWY